MQKSVQEWLGISEYDLETASAMLKAGRYLYVAFMCQQAIEKLLKAIYVYSKSKLPDRTHNLLYLIDILNIDIKNSDRELLSKLNQFYLESRYPGERLELANEMDRDKAEDFLIKTQGAWKCLRQMLQ
jgi:HEPN domain-containing protein